MKKIISLVLSMILISSVLITTPLVFANDTPVIVNNNYEETALGNFSGGKTGSHKLTGRYIFHVGTKTAAERDGRVLQFGGISGQTNVGKGVITHVEIYDPNDANFASFKPEKGKTYEITFDFKAKAGQTAQIYFNVRGVTADGIGDILANAVTVGPKDPGFYPNYTWSTATAYVTVEDELSALAISVEISTANDAGTLYPYLDNVVLKEVAINTEKGTLTGTPNMAYNIPVNFSGVPASAVSYGAKVWQTGTDEAKATDVAFADGNNAVGIKNISIYGIKNEFNVKPYAVLDSKGTVVYGDVFTTSYLEWLLMHKDNTDPDKAAAVAQINKILDIYYAATGEAAYEGQATPNLADAAAGTYVASPALSVEGSSEITVKASKPVQGSIVNGKLRVNFDYGTKTGTFGVLAYRAGKEFDAADVSNADANITFKEGAILSLDINGIAFVNYAKQYTLVPYVQNGEDIEYGNVIKVSYADFLAYALNNGNANAKQVANASCELYKDVCDADLCIAE